MHVGKTFFIFIITGCSTISMFIALLKLMFAVTMVTSIETIDINSTSVRENVCCYRHSNPAQKTVKLVGIALMYVIPVVSVICIYTRILYTTSVSISRVQHARVNTCEGQNLGQSLMPNYVHQSMPSVTDELKGAKIWKSITTLLGFFLVVTIPVSSIEIWLCIKEYNTTIGITLLYLKTLMCIFHAGGEGTFHFDKRERTRLFLYKHVLRTQTSTTLTRRNSKENVAVPATLFRPVNHLSTLNEVSTPSSSCKINVCQDQDEAVNFVNNITKSNEYDNEAFIKERSEDEVKTKEPSHCWETTDQLGDLRNSLKTPVRCGSTFMNYRIPSAQFRRLNMSSNTRRLQQRRYLSQDSVSDAADSVFSYSEIPFENPNKVSMASHQCMIPGSRTRTTSIKSPDLKDKLGFQEIKKVQNSVRTLSAISDTM